MIVSREAALVLIEEAKRDECTVERTGFVFIGRPLFLKRMGSEWGTVKDSPVGKDTCIDLPHCNQRLKAIHSANAGPHLELQGHVILVR